MGFRKAVSFCFLFAGGSAVAETVNYHIPRIDKAPVIDAVIDEQEWKNAKLVDLGYETNPGENIPARVKTTAYMMEDGENLYFAFKAYDPDPDKILAYLRDRDRIFQDDFVGVIIDTFNDERTGFEFFVNALGAQGDLTRDDARFNEDSSWDAVWESLGQVTEDGYVVEMAIPYRALRFPSGLEEQTWGINFLRIYPRDSRTSFSDRANDRNLDCLLCQTNKLKGMPKIEAGNNLDITPTLTYVRNESRDPKIEQSWQDSVSDTEVGADIRWSVTEDWILNATINPDFSQVDADGGQLDINTTFSLFFREARPFFLDGADYFASSNRLVHTRNIADPDYGLKLSGKQDGHSAGVIIARDTNTSFLLPGRLGSDLAELEGVESDVMIARYKKDLNDKGNVGALVTHRSANGYHNTVTSADGKYYFTEADSIEVQVMHSDTENPISVVEDFDVATKQSDSAYSLRYRHRTRNYNINVSLNDFGKDFRADMGFIGQVDFKKAIVGGSYNWFGDAGSRWTRWGVFGDWDKTVDQNGKLLEQENEIHFNISGPMQFQTRFGFVQRERYYNRDAELVVGNDNSYFDENRFMMFTEFKPLANLTVGNFMAIGDQVDFANTQLGDLTLFEPFMRLQLGKHFNINASTTFQTLDVPGGELFNAKLYDLRFGYQFSTRSRLSLTLQTTDIDRNPLLYTHEDDDGIDRTFKSLGTPLIYSYKINPLSLVYLGYSDRGFQDDELSSIKKEERTIFAKFSYMWQY
jgi:hypothetical protein